LLFRTDTNLILQAAYFLLLYIGLAQYGIAQSNFSFELITVEERANFGDVRSLYVDKSGIIWMGVFGKGLAYYDGKKVIRLSLAGEGDFALNRSIFTAGTDRLYLNYGHLVKCFDPIKQQVIDTVEITERSTFELLSFSKVGSENFLWAASPFKGKSTTEGAMSFHIYLSKKRSAIQTDHTTAIAYLW